MTRTDDEQTGQVGSLELITLQNDAVCVGIAAGIGRILELIPAGGGNLLWRNPPAALNAAVRQCDYLNWGGDKVWPCLQLLWARQRRGGGTEPPIAPIDGGPWQLLEQSDRRIVMRSAADDDLAVHVTRIIELHATEPRLTITNSIERIEASPLPVMIWSVTQVCRPACAMLNVAADRPGREWPALEMGPPDSPSAAGITLFDDAARWVPPPLGVYKFGTFGRWIAGVYDHTIFLQSAAYDSAGCYPDRSNIQMFCNQQFMELETLSPQVHLKPGQSLTNTVQWRLLDRPPSNGAKLAAYLAEHVD